MAKLRDIFPRWALREPQRDGNIELGGSAFAHLTEDAGQSYLFTDWGLAASPDGTYDGVYAYMDPTGQFASVMAAVGDTSLTASVVGDAESRLIVKADGSLHWGDGTAAPDVSVARAGAHALFWDGGAGAGLYMALNNGYIEGTGPNAGSAAFGAQIVGDADDRVQLVAGGQVRFGAGDGVFDAHIERSAAKTLNLTNDTGDLILKVNGVTVTVP